MSISFNGVNQGLRRTAGTPSTPIEVFPYTVCCWAYPLTTSSGQAPIGFGIADTRSNFSISTASQARWQVQAIRSDTGVGAVFTTAANNTVVANEWQFVCGTVDGSYTNAPAWRIENWSITVNDTIRKQTLGTPIATGQSYTRCSIGVWQRNTLGSYFTGYIAEAAAWDVVLSDDEIRSLAKGITAPMIRPDNLKMYFPGIRQTQQELSGGLTFDNVNSVGATADHSRRYG